MNININNIFSMDKTGDIIDKGNLLRLHVLANSNSPRDQYIKRVVRDKLIKYYEDNLASLESELNNLEKIDAFVEDILKSEGINYGAETELGQYDFPGRTYANLTLKQGKYNALRVVLGKGEGSNWWCVLLPPMCIENNEKEISDDNKIVFKSRIMEWLQNKWGSQESAEEIILSGIIDLNENWKEKRNELQKTFKLIDDNILKLKI
jgi:stage II sporulation protein R